MKPLCIDLFTGLHGWAEGFLAEGWRVIGYDIHDMRAAIGLAPLGGDFELRLQDVLTIDGRELADAHCIVASPPCQRYSYMAMPWTRAKELARHYREHPELIESDLNALFNACFHIQREASAAAKRHIPLIVENVKGAQAWVGPAKWHYGSYYLWGDVPALMPSARQLKNTGGSWFGVRDGKKLARNDPRDVRRNEAGEFESAEARGGWNHPGKALDGRWSRENGDGVKQGGGWWHDPASMTRRHSSRSSARRVASAMIARIPLPLARWIAQVYRPWPKEQDAPEMVWSGICPGRVGNERALQGFSGVSDDAPESTEGAS